MKKFKARVIEVYDTHDKVFYIANTKSEYARAYIQAINLLITCNDIPDWNNDGGQLDLFDSRKGYSTKEQLQNILAIDDYNVRVGKLFNWLFMNGDLDDFISVHYAKKLDTVTPMC